MAGRWRRIAVGLLLGTSLASAAPGWARAGTVAETGGAEAEGRAREARRFLSSIERPADLQSFLDRTVDELVRRDRSLDRDHLRVAIIDLPRDGTPRLAHVNGEERVYPASVVKFVYLMAAYRWRELGDLEIDPAVDRELHEMIYQSSNKATQKVVARLAETEPGPALPPARYAQFRDRRLRVKRWLESLGVDDLHCIHPTYDGGGDLFGRDVQLLRDRTMEGGLRARSGEYVNRQAMTAVDTAELLALLATDRALSAQSSAEVRRRMSRDPAKQPYLAKRIAGGAKRAGDLEVESKTGTWGPIFADAGIVRDRRGDEVVIAVFVDSRPAYRGSFVADLSERVTRHLLRP